VVFFFAPTTTSSRPGPGLYGWGKVLKEWDSEKKELVFRTLPPSNALQKHPLWDGRHGRIERLVRAIRSPWMGTLWRVVHIEHAIGVRKLIRSGLPKGR
jgi:hypothetical protein